MIFSINGLNRAVTTSLVTAAVAFSPIFTAIATAVTLNGAGATFPAPMNEKYAREVTKSIPDLKINYQGIGSGGGVNQTIAGTVDFGASDAAMTDAEIAKVKQGVILVPTAGGAVSAEVQKKAGQYVAPSLQTPNQALSNVQSPSNSRVFVSDPGQGYPIVGMSWIMIYKSYKDPAKAKAVKSLVE